jgi:hypothetical protein
MTQGLARERSVIEGNFTFWDRKVAVIHSKTTIMDLAVHWQEINFHDQIKILI